MEAEVKGSQFIVKFNGIKLPAEAEQSLAKALSSTFTRQIAALKVNNGLLLPYIPRRDWYGIIYRNPRLGGEIVSPRLKAMEGAEGASFAQLRAAPTGSEFLMSFPVKLDARQEAAINSALQSTAMAELARMDLLVGKTAKFPGGTWRGIWLDPELGRLNTLKIGM